MEYDAAIMLILFPLLVPFSHACQISDVTVHQYSERIRADILFLLPMPISMKQHKRVFGDVCHKAAIKLLAGFYINFIYA